MSYRMDNYHYVYHLGKLMREIPEEAIDQLLSDFPQRTLAALKYHFILGIPLIEVSRVLRDYTFRSLDNLWCEEAYDRLYKYKLEKEQLSKNTKVHF